jgi:hypothetical protein
MKTDLYTRVSLPGYQHLARFIGLALLLFFLLTPFDSAAAQNGVEFDHFSTGFPLEGAHKRAVCTSCHLRGIFKGTPLACSACHSQASMMGGDKIPEDHIKAFPLCEECHTDQFWKPLVRMNHDMVIGSCFSCHDGVTATGKMPDHITSSNSCDDCHTTSTWQRATFDHADVTPGTCFT